MPRQAYYSADYHRLDAWTGVAQKRDIYIQGLGAFGEELIPQAQLRSTEFYNDFLKPGGMEWIVTTALFDDPATPATHMIHPAPGPQCLTTQAGVGEIGPGIGHLTDGR